MGLAKVTLANLALAHVCLATSVYNSLPLANGAVRNSALATLTSANLVLRNCVSGIWL